MLGRRNTAERYLHNGDLVAIVGSLQTRKRTDQSGQSHYATEVVIGRFKGELTMVGWRGRRQQGLEWRRSRAGGPRRWTIRGVSHRLLTPPERQRPLRHHLRSAQKFS
jgi:single-stranded DNA-binding protein